MPRVHAVVRSMFSPDPGADPLDQYRPPSTDLFEVFIEFEIGSSETEGSDLFGLTVCSPRSLVERQRRPKGYEFQHAVLVMDRWDAGLIERAVSGLCQQTSGSDWHSIAESLSRFMAWEFADHRS